MDNYGYSCRRRVGRLGLRRCVFLACAAALASPTVASGAEPGQASAARLGLKQPFLVTQFPAGTVLEKQGPAAGGMLRRPFGEKARIVAVYPDRSMRILTASFHSACDPEISFDAKRLLFAGKRVASDNWNIYEMALDGSMLRQVTRDLGDCRSPRYQSPLYTIVSPKPWHQITFVSTAASALNEDGSGPAVHLYSCMLDGSAVRRLTYNLSSDMDPCIMGDGRLVFASWQRSTLRRGRLGRIALMAVSIDGTDVALFAADQGRRIKHMPCLTAKGLVVFVEADKVPWDGAGNLSCVAFRRPLHSYRRITEESDGLFHSPSPLPDGSILVSRRPRAGTGTYGVWRLDPLSGRRKPVLDDPRYHEIQARSVYPRPEPDGRSSVVTEKDPHGKLYCLNVNITDLEDPQWMLPGTATRLRVLEGVPVRRRGGAATDAIAGTSENRPTASPRHEVVLPAQRRILGEIPLERDGSFNVEIPANTPIELQLVDADGMALRTCSWIWAKNHEPRGCIGCHEDPELTPENRLMDAATRPSILLCLPPERRRTVDFRRDVMPVLSRRCSACHREGKAVPHLAAGPSEEDPLTGTDRSYRVYENLLTAGSAGDAAKCYRYVHPGSARTSPLVWQLFGRNTSRPWDKRAKQIPAEPSPGCKAPQATDEEKRTLVEWIDLGALWNGTVNVGDSSDKVTLQRETDP